MNQLFFCIAFFLLVAIPQVGFSQTDASQENLPRINPVQFDKEQLETYKNDPDFDYTEIQAENWWALFKNWVNRIWTQFWIWLLGSYTPGGIVAFLLKILPYLVIAAILGFAVWLFLKLNPAAGVLNEKKLPSVHLSEEEKLLETENIPDLIQKAIEQKNFRSAVRYYFLLVLKNLREKNLIDYQFQKTNEEYLSEIEPFNLKTQFESITYLYDFIWYGDFPLTEPGFKKAETEFLQMATLLNSDAHGK